MYSYYRLIVVFEQNKWLFNAGFKCIIITSAYVLPDLHNILFINKNVHQKPQKLYKDAENYLWIEHVENVD